MPRLRRASEAYAGHVIAAAPGTHQAVMDCLTVHAPDRRLRILDIGCHTGALIARLRDAGYEQIAGTDLTKKFDGEPFHFTPADLNEPFHDLFNGQIFDIIIASEVIEHLDNPRDFLRQAHRLLSDEGIVVITTPNVGFFEGRLKFLLTGELWGFGEKNYRLQRHISPITIEQTPLLLQECGYDLLELKTTASFATLARRILTAVFWVPMRALLGPYILGESLVLVARRINATSMNYSSWNLWSGSANSTASRGDTNYPSVND